MNSSWNLDKKAPQYTKQPKHWSNQENGHNTRPLNQGHQKYYSGKESNDLTVITGASKYHQDRESPIRKSMAASPTRIPDHLETPGYATNNLPGARPDIYQVRVKPVEQPRAHSAKQVNKQRDLLVGRLRQALAARGVRGLIGMKRQFKLMDLDNSGSLEYQEFE